MIVNWIKKDVTQETSHGVAMAGCEVDARRVESRKKSEVKTLFLVTRTDIADYQECVSLVVRAKDEAEARKLALEGYAPYDPYSSKYAGLTPYNLKVDTIPVNDESGVVLDSWLE